MRVEPLSPAQAMPLLIENLYWKAAAGSPESVREFKRCGQLALTLPAHSLSRPRDLSRLPESVAAVRRDLALLNQALAKSPTLGQTD